MFMLFGRGAIAVVATGDKEYTENGAKKGNGKGLERFHLFLFFLNTTTLSAKRFADNKA